MSDRVLPTAALATLLLAIMLSGCEVESPPAAPPAGPQAKATSMSSSSASSGPAEAVVVDGYWAQGFDAISGTAMSITGGLRFGTLGNDALATIQFEQAGTTTSVPQLKTLGLDAYSTAESATWSELLNVPMDGVVDVRKVVQESVPATAANGGLCGSQPARWIAIVRRPESEGSDSLMIAAFSSERAPSPQSDDAALCGTYSYAPH